jgi:Ala-tRNA(Pro) deacylase
MPVAEIERKVLETLDGLGIGYVRHEHPPVATVEEDRLSFASPERLRRWLGLEPGSVSPFGLVNDETAHVRVVCDEALRGSRSLGFHPNVNTATLEIAFADFEKFLASRGNFVRWLEL